jgi:hypothetical protein
MPRLPRATAVTFSVAAILGACAAPAPRAPDSASRGAPPPLAPSASPGPSAPSVPSASPAPTAPPASIVKRRPPTFDGALPAPGMTGSALGVGRDLAWVELVAVGHNVAYFALVDLKTLCVVETRTADEIGDLFKRELTRSQPDDRILEVLASERVTTALGDLLALRNELAFVSIGAVLTRAPRTGGAAAVSADGRVIALAIDARVFLSSDGGHHYRRIEAGPASWVGDMHVSSDGARIAFSAGQERSGLRSSSAFVVLDVRGAPREVARIPLHDGDAPGLLDTHVVTAEGHHVFARTGRRCFATVDPWAPEVHLSDGNCLQGRPPGKDHFFAPQVSPSGRAAVMVDGDFQATRGTLFRLDEPSPNPVAPIAGLMFANEFDLHNITLGPTDEGRFFWERAGGARVLTREGTFDVATRGSPVAFDLDGNVLTFRQPPLEKPHPSGTMMPRAKGTLADVQCRLFERHDPLRGARVRRKP